MQYSFGSTLEVTTSNLTSGASISGVSTVFRSIVDEFGLEGMPSFLFMLSELEDSFLGYNIEDHHMYHERTKHIDIKHHFIRETIAEGKVFV